MIDRLIKFCHVPHLDVSSVSPRCFLSFLICLLIAHAFMELETLVDSQAGPASLNVTLGFPESQRPTNKRRKRKGSTTSGPGSAAPPAPSKKRSPGPNFSLTTQVRTRRRRGAYVFYFYTFSFLDISRSRPPAVLCNRREDVSLFRVLHSFLFAILKLLPRVVWFSKFNEYLSYLFLMSKCFFCKYSIPLFFFARAIWTISFKLQHIY